MRTPSLRVTGFGLLAALLAAALAPLAAENDEPSYAAATRGTRWLETRPGGLAIKVLVERANLGGDEVELGEITFPPNSRIGDHPHGSVEMFYVLEGRLEHVVNGRSHVLEKGMVGIVRPGDRVQHNAGPEGCKALVVWAPGGEVARLAPGFRIRPVGDHD